MSIITKAVIFVALVCAISALPVENGQEQQEAQVDLQSVDDIPDQDVGSPEDGQVRDKRTIYGGFGVPFVSVGYGGFGGYGGYPYYGGGYGGYGGYGGGYGGYGYRRHYGRHYGYWG